jgi:hypothetical protein
LGEQPACFFVLGCVISFIRQVLIMAEKDSHIKFDPVSKANYVEGNANIDALYLARAHWFSHWLRQ